MVWTSDNILGSLGLDVSEDEDALGTLSGTVSASGVLQDPRSIEVIQKLVFKAPAKRPAAVARLRGAFTH
jgi:hypothetical protein